MIIFISIVSHKPLTLIDQKQAISKLAKVESSGRGDLDHTTYCNLMTQTAVVALWAVCAKTEMILTELIDCFLT